MFGRAFGKLFDWQGHQPPILFLVTWPAFLVLAILCVIKGVCFNAPYYLTRVLLGYYQCDNCKQWFHVWKHGKGVHGFFDKDEFCQECGTEYWLEFHRNVKEVAEASKPKRSNVFQMHDQHVH